MSAGCAVVFIANGGGHILKLYAKRGFTTVAEITREAGLAERTFFRHFVDKREILFGRTRSANELVVYSYRCRTSS